MTTLLILTNAGQVTTATTSGGSNDLGLLLTVIGLALTVVGLAVAFASVRSSRKQMSLLGTSLEHIEVVSGDLDRLAHALPTRVLGDWPTYLTDLARMIDRAKEELLILCDVPTYGVFSNPKGSVEYQRAIEHRLIEGVDTKIIFLNAKRRFEINDQFFLLEKDWPAEYRAKIGRWGETHGGGKAPKDRADFIEMLEQTNLDMIKNLERAALLGASDQRRRVLSYRETQSIVPLYVWVSDRTEAVFAVADLGEVDKTIAFVTIDPHLIAALVATFNRYRDDPGTSEELHEWQQ